MSWLPVEQLSDDVMVIAAARRAPVRLRSGYVAQLVRWRGRRRASGGVGNQARCQTTVGSRFNVRCAEIVELWVEPG